MTVLGSMATMSRRATGACWAAGLTAVLVTVALTGCGPGSAPVASDKPSAAASSPATSSSAPPTPNASAEPTTPPVALDANVADGARKVKVDTLVSVQATGGKLSKVSLHYDGTDAKGQSIKGSVPGTLSKDRSAWKADERLEPSATYALKMTGHNADRDTVTKTSVFTTQALTLAEQTFPELYPLADSHVGVGMPVILRFDVAVKNRREFEKNLHVTSTPKQAGSWHWYSDKLVHFRPESYWQPGTKVQVSADLNGVNAGGGVYGQRSTSTSFTVGKSVVTKVNLASRRAKVYVNGELKRTIPISGGKPGWQTRSGAKLIMDKLYTTRMTNAMIGAAETYDLNVHYAMRITQTGEFLHAAPWNTGYFGRTNASHGCVGMSTGDASWLFAQVDIGSPVITTGSTRGLEQGNGWTDWDMSWAKYQQGSAL